MKQFFSIVTTIIILVMMNNAVFGQTKVDTITIKKGLGTTYFYKGKKLTYNKLVQVLSTNKNTDKEATKMDVNNTISMFVGGIGGFMVGYSLGQSMGGGEMNTGMMGIGLALVAIDIPLEIGKSRHMKKAVSIYNEEQQKLSSRRMDYHFQLAPTAIGFCMHF